VVPAPCGRGPYSSSHASEAAGGILELEGVTGTTSGPLSLAVELEIRPGAEEFMPSISVSRTTPTSWRSCRHVGGTAVESASFATVDVVGEGVVASVSLDADPAWPSLPGPRARSFS